MVATMSVGKPITVVTVGLLDTVSLRNADVGSKPPMPISPPRSALNVSPDIPPIG